MTTLREILTADPRALGYNGPSLQDEDRNQVYHLGRPAEVSSLADVGDRAATVVLHHITGWGDYAGSVYDRSNFECLQRDYPDTFGEDWSGYGYHVLTLPLDEDIDPDLVEILRELADEYPVYDDCAIWELEEKLEQEDWDSYGHQDFSSELTDAVSAKLRELDIDLDVAGEAALTDHLGADDLRDRLFEEQNKTGESVWEVETAVGGYYRGLREIAQAWADELVGDWLFEQELECAQRAVVDGQLALSV